MNTHSVSKGFTNRIYPNLPLSTLNLIKFLKLIIFYNFVLSSLPKTPFSFGEFVIQRFLSSSLFGLFSFLPKMSVSVWYSAPSVSSIVSLTVDSKLHPDSQKCMDVMAAAFCVPGFSLTHLVVLQY